MAGPLEQLEAIRQLLGDLPQMLAAVMTRGRRHSFKAARQP
jgi:hypothetical protein